MQIVLPPELEELVQRQLSRGKYQTAIEVLRYSDSDCIQARVPNDRQERAATVAD